MACTFDLTMIITTKRCQKCCHKTSKLLIIVLIYSQVMKDLPSDWTGDSEKHCSGIGLYGGEGMVGGKIQIYTTKQNRSIEISPHLTAGQVHG